MIASVLFLISNWRPVTSPSHSTLSPHAIAQPERREKINTNFTAAMHTIIFPAHWVASLPHRLLGSYDSRSIAQNASLDYTYVLPKVYTMSCLMRDEKEGRSMQDQTNKAKQHSTPKAVTCTCFNER